MIPKAPLVLITLLVQVVAVTLLETGLVFLILLLNNKKNMGDLTNTLSQNIINVVIVVAIITVSSLYGIGTLFPNMFK